MRIYRCKSLGCKKQAQHHGYCRICGRARERAIESRFIATLNRQREERAAATAKRVAELQNVPYDATYHGKLWTVIWAGRGSLPGMGDTPSQLGCSLLDVSRVVR